MFSRIILFNKNSTVLPAIWVRKKDLKKISNTFSNCHLEIGIYLNIVKYLNTVKHISKNIKLNKKRDRNKKSWKQYKKVFGDFFF